MNETEFWALIGLLGGSVGPEGAELLVGRLAGRDAVAVEGFAEWLHAKLYDLDTRAHFVAARDGMDDGIPLSEDAFVALRCAVVAAGEQTYLTVLRDPSRFAGRWDAEDAEELLLVPEQASERSGRLWEFWPHRDVETGSNSAGWPAESNPAQGVPLPAPEWPWFAVGVVLHCSLAALMSVSEQEFDDTVHLLGAEFLPHVAGKELEALGVNEVFVALELGAPAAPTRVRRRGAEVVASVYRPIDDRITSKAELEGFLREALLDGLNETLRKMRSRAASRRSRSSR